MGHQVPARMTAVQLTGHGGLDALRYREDVPTPTPGAGEVLIKVAAAGVNNTDINTRIGWYSKKVTEATDTGGAGGFKEVDDDDATWSGAPIAFPRIQGADCCGQIVAVGEGVDAARIGERVIVRNMLRSYVEYRPFECWTFGSECDGAFAQYARAPSRETHAVNCDWTDAELASVPCSWLTAENMLHRASVGAERVLVTGASGGVGSGRRCSWRSVAARMSSPLPARRRPMPSAQSAPMRLSTAMPIWPPPSGVMPSMSSSISSRATSGRLCSTFSNAEVGMPRPEQSPARSSGSTCERSISRTCRCSGARFRTTSCSRTWSPISNAERLRPVVAGTFPLRDIGRAQEVFLAKKFTGKLVLIPPG